MKPGKVQSLLDRQVRDDKGQIYQSKDFSHHWTDRQ